MDTQSVHAVIYNDDLLIEILLRLPVISLVLFKLVCKRWLSLISNPTFTLRRSQIPTLDPPCGLLVQAYLSSGEYCFLSFDTRIPCKSSVLKNPFTFGYNKDIRVKIIQSCNGFLLLRCSIRDYSNYNSKYMHYVYNPCINLLKMVPQCSIETVYITRIAFDPTKSPHYKVIHPVFVKYADDDGNMDLIQIQTYSSETNMWSVCTGRFPHDSYLYFEYGIYWNDELCWKNGDDNPLLLKLDTNVEHQTLTTIKPPRTLDVKVSWRDDCKLFETCGCLLLLCKMYHFPQLMDVYEMRKGFSEWSLKYRVNLNDDVSCPRRSCANPIVHSIVLGEREEDSFIVIQDSTKIFQYKHVLKASHELYDLKSANYRCHSFQFTASFAGVGL